MIPDGLLGFYRTAGIFEERYQISLAGIVTLSALVGTK